MSVTQYIHDITARRSARKARGSRNEEASSPPAKERRVDSSPGGDLAPLPSSPGAPAQQQPDGEQSLFSSPPQSRAGGRLEEKLSEIRNEPSHEYGLSVLRKRILQTSMHSHPVGLDV